MKIISRSAVIIFLCLLTFGYLGCKKDKVVFDYLRPSEGDTTTLIGLSGTERPDSAANSVFLDLSKEVQTTVLRNAWDLGFYCGADDFRVIINHSMGATAVLTGKTDIANATAADSTSSAATLILNTTTGNANAVDAVTGDSSSYIKGTVISSISEIAADNKVYLIKRGNDSRPFNSKIALEGIFVQVSRITNGYSIKYRTIADVNARTVTVLKDISYNFKYLSFTSSTTTVEPTKLLWDLEYGLTTYTNGTTPVVRPDFVMINFMAGVKAAQLMTTTKSFTSFGASDLTGITWLGTRDAIGTKWFDVERSAAATASTPGGSLIVYSDRFFLIKDAKGNVYKLSFAGGGSRGRPIVQYILLVDNEPKNQ